MPALLRTLQAISSRSLNTRQLMKQMGAWKRKIKIPGIVSTYIWVQQLILMSAVFKYYNGAKAFVSSIYICMYIYVYIYMYICMYMCMYVYMYIYMSVCPQTTPRILIDALLNLA